MADRLANISPATVYKQVSEFLATRLNVLRNVRDALDSSQDKKKEQPDAKGRGCMGRYEVGGQVLLMLKTYLRMQCPLSSRRSFVHALSGRSRSSLRRDLLTRSTSLASCTHTLCSTLAYLSRIGIRPLCV